MRESSSDPRHSRSQHLPWLGALQLRRFSAADGTDLAASFGHALEQANTLEHASTTAAERFAAGDPGMGIHEVMIASEKANIAVRYATTLKNKALEAYRDLMNTSV